MADQTERSPRAVRLTDMEDIGASLDACIVCGSPDIVTQHAVTIRGRDFAVTVASWCEKPECEEDRRLTVLSVGMLPPNSIIPAIDPDDEALVERVRTALIEHFERQSDGWWLGLDGAVDAVLKAALS